MTAYGSLLCICLLSEDKFKPLLKIRIIVVKEKGFVWFCFILPVVGRCLFYSAFRIIRLCVLKVYLLLSL